MTSPRLSLLLPLVLLVSCDPGVLMPPGSPGSGGSGGATGSGGGGGIDPGSGGSGGGSGGSGGQVGGSGGSGGPMLHPDFTVTAQLDSANTTLGVSHQVTATVTPADGFTGAVALTTTGLPNGWTFQAQNATITGAQPVMVQGTLNVPTNTTAGMVSFDLQASGGGKMHSAALSILVKGELIIHIAQGVATNNNSTAFGPNPTAVPFVPPGTKVTWINDDTIAHRIHSDNGNGFNHEPDNMNPGESYSVTITGSGGYDYHCHIHTGMTGHIDVGQ